MKNLLFIISVTMVLFAATDPVQGKNIPPTNKSEELSYIKHLIDQNIDYPKACSQFDCGIVKAKIKINVNQGISVLEINGNPVLTEYIINQLQHITVAYPRLIGRELICNFDFRKN
ncbi:hypothetical protein L21SP5_03710 [Salinivirga cyanobacteriivorans]|uniref:TonB C-terminal domain-containing protein n=1 Tax=Salinivirga cyanobacteriivorans TaxID=1307839 RepID=A0A0S2I5R9_9BACT|nr:hypothetical protein [Salinivirga cyanobacteriivorans]ALO17308.1 hypothetical protein L21SP5_03710 [Salinivirga cyanobacteriivorans]